MSKRTMTLNLTDDEMQVLEELCVKKGLNKTGGLEASIAAFSGD